MKKLILLSFPIVYFLFLTGCNEGEQEKNKDGSKKTVSSPADTTAKSKKHLAFFNDSLLNVIKEDKTKYFSILADFELMDTAKFESYHLYFKEFFKIDSPAPIITNFVPPSISIFAKYDTVQHNLEIKPESYTRPASGTQPEILYQNRVRLYPALTAAGYFYIYIMAERKEETSTSDLFPITNTSEFYSIKGGTLTKTTQIKQAERDILNFQKKWLDSIAPKYPGFIFDSVRSFTYSIKEYNQLIGNDPGYWEWTDYQTNPTPKNMAKLFPVVITDLPGKPGRAFFKLVFLPYTINQGNEERDSSRGFFDNMDVCPDKCPTNSIEL